MSIATSVKRYLDSAGVAFKEHPHNRLVCLKKLTRELGIDSHQIAVPVLLKSDKDAIMMAVIPLDHDLDVSLLNTLLNRQFLPVDCERELSLWFDDVEPGAYPPVAAAYKLPLIVDRHLLTQKRIFFKAGTHSNLVSVEQSDFQFLCGSAPKAIISNPQLEKDTAPQQVDSVCSEDDIKAKIESLYRLPVMPSMANEVVRLLNDEETTVEQLSDVVELDPCMSAQVLRYACSPYYGYKGKIDSIQQAITSVLGFDLVSSIVLGIASSQVFNLPKDGPLGMRSFWRHALYCAMLSQAIAKKAGFGDSVNPSMAYLSGLLHNIGVLLIGYLFPPEFKMLNKWVENHAKDSLSSIEKNVIGMGHAQKVISLGHHQIGSLLMDSWNMPAEVIACCEQHHNGAYEDEYADYVKIVRLSNQLLAQGGIGDLGQPLSSAESFGILSEKDLEQLYAEVMEMSTSIDELAEQMAA